MSTRAVVAVGTRERWEGRYVHMDGYPTGLGWAIWEIVKRDGVEAARKALVRDADSWSAIDPEVVAIADLPKDVTPENTHELSAGESLTYRAYKYGGAQEPVVGYGVKHTDGEGAPITPADSPRGLEWLYVIADDGVHFAEATDRGDGGQWVFVAHVSWDMRDPEWHKIEHGELPSP